MVSVKNATLVSSLLLFVSACASDFDSLSLSNGQVQNEQAIVMWISEMENQSELIDKIYGQIIEGGLDGNAEVSAMMFSLKNSLNEINKVFAHQDMSSLCSECKEMDQRFAMRSRKLNVNDYFDEDIDDRLSNLRELEKLHKNEAFELILQATGEAIGAGISAANGVAALAIYEGFQSSRHFVRACQKYNEGVRCQEEADSIEQEHSSDNDGQIDRKWWEIWK